MQTIVYHLIGVIRTPHRAQAGAVGLGPNHVPRRRSSRCRFLEPLEARVVA